MHVDATHLEPFFTEIKSCKSEFVLYLLLYYLCLYSFKNALRYIKMKLLCKHKFKVLKPVKPDSV